MDLRFSVVPAPYGTVHLLILAGIAAGVIGLYFVLKNRSDAALLRLLLILGCCMVLTEIWKQWFVARYVYPGVLSTWFFPWQLCSMSMYCAVLVPFLKDRAQDAVLVFLSTFSVVAAAAALLFPGDMLRPQVLLFCHSFWYHGTMLVESLAAILLLSRRKKAPFGPALLLFLAMAAVAECINVVSHAVVHDFSIEANMFHITPYYPSTQPVFHDIAVSLGILPEILIYLGVLALFSFGLHRLEQRIFCRA